MHWLFLLDGYKEEDMTYEWKKENPVQLTPESSDFLNDGISLAGTELESCDVETSTGKYSCIRLVFKFKKDPLVSI